MYIKIILPSTSSGSPFFLTQIYYTCLKTSGIKYIKLGIVKCNSPQKPKSYHKVGMLAFSQNFAVFFFLIHLFIYFWLHWVFGTAHGLSLLVESRGYSSCGAWASHCGGFSCCGAQALGARASVIVAHGLSCSTACGIFLDQGSNLCPLHWQVDS